MWMPCWWAGKPSPSCRFLGWSTPRCWQSPWKAAEFAIIILVVQQVDGNFIAPRILGGATGLPGLGVLLAIVVGGAWFGIPGMALGVPTLAVVAALLKQAVGAGLAARGLDADALDRDFPPMDTQN